MAEREGDATEEEERAEGDVTGERREVRSEVMSKESFANKATDKPDRINCQL